MVLGGGIDKRNELWLGKTNRTNMLTSIAIGSNSRR